MKNVCFLFFFLHMQKNKRMKKRDRRKMYDMLFYCENDIDCRRVLLLNMFGERYNSEDCLKGAGCDNCEQSLGGNICEENVTFDALAIVDIVDGLGKKYKGKCTYDLVIQIFKGSTAKTVQSVNGETVTGFGAGNQWNANDVRRLITKLLC